MKIYVVMGTCGEYSDRSEWAVIAYYDEQKAQEHVLKASRRAKELQIAYDERWVEGQNEFDPNIRLDYTGTEYFYYTVPFESLEAD